MISKIGLALSNVVAAILILTMYLERKFIEIKQCMSAVHDKYYQKKSCLFWATAPDSSSSNSIAAIHPKEAYKKQQQQKKEKKEKWRIAPTNQPSQTSIHPSNITASTFSK